MKIIVATIRKRHIENTKKSKDSSVFGVIYPDNRNYIIGDLVKLVAKESKKEKALVKTSPR